MAPDTRRSVNVSFSFDGLRNSFFVFFFWKTWNHPNHRFSFLRSKPKKKNSSSSSIANKIRPRSFFCDYIFSIFFLLRTNVSNFLRERSRFCGNIAPFSKNVGSADSIGIVDGDAVFIFYFFSPLRRRRFRDRKRNQNWDFFVFFFNGGSEGSPARVFMAPRLSTDPVSTTDMS